MEQKKYLKSYQYFRAAACIAVIVIHTISMGLLSYQNTIHLSTIIINRVILNNFMWAVPGFLMVSGALLLDSNRKITYKKIFNKYIVRVLLAIIVFCTLFAIFDYIFDNKGIGINQLSGDILEIFTGKSWSHMWYLYCLIGIYLMLPFYRKITKYSTKREIEYLLILYLIFLSLLPVCKVFGIEIGFYIYTSSIYPFWFLLGYYISKWPKSKKTYAILALSGTILLSVATFIRWKFNIEQLDCLFEYSSVLVIIQAFGIAGLFFDCKTGVKLEKFLLITDKHSFGIYLIHLMFLRYLYKNMQYNPFETNQLSQILVVAIVFILSYISDVILSKLPLFRKIL